MHRTTERSRRTMRGRCAGFVDWSAKHVKLRICRSRTSDEALPVSERGACRLTSQKTVQLIYDYLFPTMWVAWGVYWIISARNVKMPVRRESTLSRWAHYGPLALAGWLLSDGGRI